MRMQRWQQGPASLLGGRAAAIPALGPASRRSSEGLALTSSVPAAPAPVAPGAQPQMSSHNSRLAADSYKNCVWTISGEAPEFRAPVSGGAPLRSLGRNTQEVSGAAHPTTSQTRRLGPCRGKVGSKHADPAPRGESPSPQACVSFDRGPGSLEWPVLGLGAAPGWGNLLRQARGTPTSPLPAPSLGFPGSPGIRKAGAEAGGVSEPGSDCWTRGSPAPAIPAHAPAGVLSASLWLSRGRRRGALECTAGSPVLPGEPGWEPAGWRGAGLSPSGASGGSGPGRAFSGPLQQYGPGAEKGARLQLVLDLNNATGPSMVIVSAGNESPLSLGLARQLQPALRQLLKT